jgi:predicted nicotinamide N-methyase
MTYDIHSWRAAEHLGQFVIDKPELFKGRSICELGAGLGLVAVLIDKLQYSKYSKPETGTEAGSGTVGTVCIEGSLVATDGDEPTVSLLTENKFGNGCSFDVSFLYWGKYNAFLSQYPQKFEVLMAADVIYEEAQVEPLVETVCAIMKGEGCCMLYAVCCM